MDAIKIELIKCIVDFYIKKMGNNHSHHHSHHELSGRNLFISILLNIVITVAQIIGGFISGSLSLISDAIHNLSDVISLMSKGKIVESGGFEELLSTNPQFKRMVELQEF